MQPYRQWSFADIAWDALEHFIGGTMIPTAYFLADCPARYLFSPR